MNEFSDKYCQSAGNDTAARTLGRGGASSGVERCTDRETGCDFAVKRVSVMHHVFFPYLIENEIEGLEKANNCKVPRVVKLEDAFATSEGDGLVVLELVPGVSLGKLVIDLSMPAAAEAADVQQHEQQVMGLASQLVQTVHYLHMRSNVAHLDITSSNIMLRNDDFEAWDQVRLLDFGFSQFCSSDHSALDVAPQGATAAYAAPEVLRSLQMQFEGAPSTQAGVPLNGPSADWWSTGMVLYEVLTGDLPFCGRSCSTPKQAPENVPHRCKAQWEDYERVRQLQQTWVDACALAQATQSEVQHPLLDKVKQCSAHPDEAASFFFHLLHPLPYMRSTRLDHPWYEPLVSQMLDDMGISSGCLTKVPEFKTRSKAKSGWCAALCGCCFGASPTKSSKRQAERRFSASTLAEQQHAVTLPDGTLDRKAVVAIVGEARMQEMDQQAEEMWDRHQQLMRMLAADAQPANSQQGTSLRTTDSQECVAGVRLFKKVTGFFTGASKPGKFWLSGKGRGSVVAEQKGTAVLPAGIVDIRAAAGAQDPQSCLQNSWQGAAPASDQGMAQLALENQQCISETASQQCVPDIAMEQDPVLLRALPMPAGVSRVTDSPGKKKGWVQNVKGMMQRLCRG